MTTEINEGKMRRKKGRSLKKWFFYGLISLFGLFLLAAIAVPLLVDVDKFRPQILAEANKHIEGKLELGKLKLSLWGKVQIDIDGLKLSDTKDQAILQVKDAGFHLPLWTLLTGRPELRLILNNPEIHLVKNLNGKLNILETAKLSQTANTQEPPQKSSSVPTLLLTSRFTFLIQKADVSYIDQKTKDNYKISDLNFTLRDVSPLSKMPFEVSAGLNLEMQNKTKVMGPFWLKGEATPVGSITEIKGINAAAELNFDKLEIISGDAFHKKSGVPFNLKAEVKAGKDSFELPSLKLRLAEIELLAKGLGQTSNETTTLQLKLDTNKIDLAKLGEISPLAQSYALNGFLDIDLKLQGPLEKLGYAGNLKLTDVKLHSDSMLQPLALEGSLKLVPNEIESLVLNLKAQEFDFNLNGKLQDFSKPRFQFSMTSHQMNLDKLLKSSSQAAEKRKTEAKGNSEQAAGKTGSTSGSESNVVDYNALFTPLRQNPMAAEAKGSVQVSIQKLSSTGVKVENLSTELVWSDLVFSMKDLTMKLFDGGLKGSLNFNLKSAKPIVNTNLAVTNLQTQKMAESQMAMAKNSIQGKISAAMNIGGMGLNNSDIQSNWKGSGNLSIQDAVFSTFEIGKQIRDGVLSKLPDFLKSKINLPESLVNQKGEYDLITMKYNLSNGTFEFGDLIGKAHPGRGLDLRGSGKVQLGSYDLDTTLDFIDTYNLTKGDSIARDKRYGHFTLSPRVTGTVFSPRFDWGSTIARLAQGAAEQKGKEFLEKAVKDKLPGGLGGVLKGLGGGSGSNNGNNNGDHKEANPADAVKGALKGLFGH